MIKWRPHRNPQASLHWKTVFDYNCKMDVCVCQCDSVSSQSYTHLWPVALIQYNFFVNSLALFFPFIVTFFLCLFHPAHSILSTNSSCFTFFSFKSEQLAPNCAIQSFYFYAIRKVWEFYCFGRVKVILKVKVLFFVFFC